MVTVIKTEDLVNEYPGSDKPKPAPKKKRATKETTKKTEKTPAKKGT